MKESTNELRLQDGFVRAAIASDDLVTKEHVLRKKLLDNQRNIPKLCKFPYLIDVEYICFDKEDDNKYRIKPGQGDLLFTNGENEYVAVEIKSSYVCFNGSDRVQITKTTRLMEQVHFYQEYQRSILGENVKVHGCGVTEQKIYWIDEHGQLEQHWWSSGPDDIPSREQSIFDGENMQPFEDAMDIEDIPEEYQELHSQFLEESIAKHYTLLQFYGNGKLVYLSKCKHKRITVCKEHIAQKEIDEIKQRDRQDGFRHGQLLMFGQIRPTLMSF